MRWRAVGVLVVLATAGCSAAPPAPAAPTATRTTTVAVRDLLDRLPVRPETTGTRFDRDRFGYGGDLDPDGDGCWTRREVLIRDSVVTPRIGSSCSVSGEWRSSLDGATMTDPAAFTIDHTVPLLEAWRSGADAWPARRLVAYGNDLGYRWSLQAVSARLNEDKGNADPARWLPPRDRCAYVAAWVGVKARWALAVDARELQALEAVLDGCGAVQVEAPGVPDLDALT